MQTMKGKSDRKSGRRVAIDLQKAERALKDGRHGDVEETCSEILEERPGHVYALQVLAELRIKQGRPEEADALAEEAARNEPDNPRTLTLQGRLRVARGALGEAEPLFRKSVAGAPEYADAHACLGDVLRRTGRPEEAEAEFREAIRYDQEHGLANLSLGAMLYERRRPDQAVPHLQAGLKRELAHREAQFTLATALYELGRTDEAITAFRRLVATGDADPASFSRLAAALESTGDLEIASAGYEAALELDPSYGPAAAGLAGLLGRTGKPAAAMRLLAPHLRGGDGPADVRIAQARLLARTGRREQALAQLGGVLKASLSPAQAIAAHALVGDLLDAMGHYDRAFAHYRRANALGEERYSREAREREVARAIEVFTPQTIDAIPRGSESDAPVFVVGMPRSGASLVERIVAGHPRGAGAGALPHIGLSAGRIGRYNKAGVPYPECVRLLIRKDVQELSSGYLVRLLAEHDRARRIVDSMWQNFDHLGFIEILFPNARIIHCRRDPVDAGLSCYFQPYAMPGTGFTRDLADIGHYYGQHCRLADHWRAQSRLRMLEVDYEAIVASPGEEARRIMDFLELPWDPACLDFPAPPGREPGRGGEAPGIYPASVGRAVNYAAHVGPLKDALAAAGHSPAQ